MPWYGGGGGSPLCPRHKESSFLRRKFSAFRKSVLPTLNLIAQHFSSSFFCWTWDRNLLRIFFVIHWPLSVPLGEWQNKFLTLLKLTLQRTEVDFPFSTPHFWSSTSRWGTTPPHYLPSRQVNMLRGLGGEWRGWPPARRARRPDSAHLWIH